MQTIPKIMKKILQDPQAAVLSMIVNVEGSSYRKEGTWMLLLEDGYQIGVISGGCLENDLHTRAKDLFGTGRTETVHYDLRAEDDFGWGRGVGCNGVVTVFIRDIDEDFRKFLGFMYRQLLANEPMYFIQSMKNAQDYECMGRTNGRFCKGQLVMPFDLEPEKPYQKKAGQLKRDDESYFYQLIWPQPSLYIIGAGSDARPLVRFSAQAGYAVHLVDWRSEICNELHCPDAVSIQIGNVEELVSQIPFCPLDSIVIMTHNFQIDAAVINYLLDYDLLYLGILGSKKRTERLLQGEVPSKVHSPVGLSIGADGPEEIAVSITAQLIAVRQGK